MSGNKLDGNALDLIDAVNRVEKDMDGEVASMTIGPSSQEMMQERSRMKTALLSQLDSARASIRMAPTGEPFVNWRTLSSN